MAYQIRIGQIGKSGVPNGRLTQYEADTEMEAVTLAAYEVDVSRAGPQRVATVSNPSGLLVLAYVGCVRARAGDGW